MPILGQAESAVHPRVGGEHLRHLKPKRGTPGSSPRGRGTLEYPNSERLHSRFIPAWAGNTVAYTAPTAMNAVHPRVGGEHLRTCGCKLHRAGSSPRGRGTQRRRLLPRIRMRFIPAWAGNTANVATALSKSPVHPRVGGEHIRAIDRPQFIVGSSPRGRGTLANVRFNPDHDRFIPAWAGNTRIVMWPLSGCSVHPRVGGEHVLSLSPPSSITGSSPRGRGTRGSADTQCNESRFIPAWAGNTGGESGDGDDMPVHPRVGGEHPICSAASAPLSGSSPRGRGTPPPTHDGGGLCRFIPAWAGNTSHTTGK